MRKTISIILIFVLSWLTLASNILAQTPKMSLRQSNTSPAGLDNYNVVLSTFSYLPQVKSKPAHIFAAPKVMSYKRDQWLKVKKGQERAKEAQAKLEEGIEFNLPYESKLNISGRKMINIKTGKIKYAHPDQKTITGTPLGVTDRLDMQQELQVKIKGKVGPKITVNIDYDDTKEDKRDISVVYKGDPEEVVQEAAFGDIDLTLPQTEFVSYNKKLFGGKIDTLPVSTDNHKLRVMGIGSRTKGVTETKHFKGNTTFEKRELFDTQYIRRKYYKIYPDDSAASSDLPITSGSVEIYIDNRIGTDNTNALNMNAYDSNGVAYNGYFDKQNAGLDYTVDYRTGIITFNKAIGSNYVIAVDYKRPDGTWLSSGLAVKFNTLRIIKDEFETPITREMKNYYSLGSTKLINDPNKFIVKIMDLNRNELNSSAYPYEVDYDFGTIRFLDDTPFDPPYPDVYINIPTHHFIIYVEYRHSVKTYNLRPGLVQKSEKVKLNGEELIRDEDYFIDYDIGLLTFLKDAAITDDTDIEVDYEYMPFGGQFQQTIVGARTEYEYGDKFTMGSTVLYNWATSPGNIPDIRSTPESTLVIEGDSKLKLRPKELWKWDLEGLNIDLGAEVAQSKYNPDIFGKAMVDNMEGSEIADTISTDKVLWRLGSLGRDPLKRGTLEWANGDEDKHSINSNTTEEGRDQTLDLTYTLPETDSWASLVYPISTAGIDYSKHNYLQFWVYGDGMGENLHVDLGRVSEDADGKGGFEHDVPLDGPVRWPKGSPKTEDLNGNGLLDIGEDIGWEYDDNGTIVRIGAGNGLLDSEDLDGDGILNTVESIANAANLINVTWTGWQQIIIPLDVNDTNLAIWQNIKHIRFWLTRGNESHHTIRIAKMEIVGNRWDKPILSGTGTMAVAVKSNEDDSNVSLNDNGDYRWLYRDTVNKDLDENNTLVLQYANLAVGEEGYTKRQLSKSLDFSKHKKMRFFVYGDSKGEDFYLRIGSDDSNYFEYRQTIDWAGWQMISIDLPVEFTRTQGFPSLSNILLLRMGIIGNGTPGTNEIWVDEIHLIDPIEEVGLAQKYSLDSTYKDMGTMNAKYRSINDKFSMVGIPKLNQDITAQSVSGTLSKLHLKEVNFPAKYSWDKSTIITPTTFRTELSSLAEGKVITDIFNVQTVLTKGDSPQLGLNYTRNIADSNLQQQLKKTYTYGSTLVYNNKPKVWKPLRLTLPDTFNSYYNRIHGYTYYDGSLKKNTGYEDLFEQTDDFLINPTYIFQLKSGSTAKAPVKTGTMANINTGLSAARGADIASEYFNRLTISPLYKRRKTAETKTFYDDISFKRKKSDAQTIGLNTTVELFKWLNPTFKYSIDTNETYNVNASSKNVNRASITEIFNILKMKDLWSWSPLNSLTVNNRYRIDEGDIYDNADATYQTLNKLWVKKQLESGDLKSTNRLIMFENTVRWLPFEFLNLKGGLRPFKTVDTTTKYTKTNEHRMITGTPYDSFSKTFPDINLIIRELEYFPAMSSFLEASQLDLKYNLKTIDKVDISLSRENNWGAKWRGKLFKKYTLLLNMDQTKTKETDPSGVTLRDAIADNKGTQVNFRTTRNFIFVFSYDDRKQSEKDRYGAILRQEYTRTPAMKMEKDLEFPKGLRIPFTKKVWDLKNLVHLTTAIKTIILRSNVAEKNNNTYSAAASVDYNVSYNFVVTLGIDGSLVKNKELGINDYYTYGANFKLLIRF